MTGTPLFDRMRLAIDRNGLKVTSVVVLPVIEPKTLRWRIGVMLTVDEAESRLPVLKTK